MSDARGSTARRAGPGGALRGYLGRDEVRRRAVHAAGGLVPMAYLLGLLTWPQLRLLYIAGLGATAILEIARLAAGLDWWLLGELTREYERENLAGYALYVVGSTVAVLVFEPRVAVPALLLLAVVDPVSGLLADNEFGEPKRPAVLAVTFLLSAGVAIPFVPLASALLAAAVTTVADGYTPVVRGHAIDDNLTIPVGAAAAMWVGLWLPV